MLGPADFNASPQAVFTSFKLPKPGGGQPGQAMPAAALAPVPTPSSAAELLAMAAAGPDFKFSLAGGGGGSGGGVEKVFQNITLVDLEDGAHHQYGVVIREALVGGVEPTL